MFFAVIADMLVQFALVGHVIGAWDARKHH